MNVRFKAIETRYNQHLFRSRLEARWAVFFDSLGIKWEYELEGYEFDNYRYLPDFYFTDYDYFAEIKPNDNERADFDRWCSFVSNSGKPLLLLYGSPNANPTTLITNADMGGLCDTIVPFANLISERYGLFYGSDTESFNNYFEKAIVTAKEKQFEYTINTTF